MKSISMRSLQTLESESFQNYGSVIDDLQLENFAKQCVDIPLPKEGNIYQRSHPPLEASKEAEIIAQRYFGGMKIQIGYCNGRKNSLNALEYHKSSELIFAATDLVLILGLYASIKHDKYHTKNAESFFLKKNTLLELYPLVLHFAPCSVSKAGFKSLIILPRGTNEPLQKTADSPYLFAKNKWLLAHREATWLIEEGAKVGLEGDNLEVVL